MKNLKIIKKIIKFKNCNKQKNSKIQKIKYNHIKL